MNLRLLTLIILLIGFALFVYALTLPYYTNVAAADELLAHAFDMDKKVYYSKEAALRTDKLFYMDLGSGLIVAALAILLFLFLVKVKTLADFGKLKTVNRATIVAQLNIAWILLLPGNFWYYYFRGIRGDYPPFADSIGIPLMSGMVVFLVLMIPLNVFIVLATKKTDLPTQLFIKATQYTRAAIAWEIFFGFFLLLNCLLLLVFVSGGDHVAIVVNLFFTYGLLTLRAGQISRWAKQPELSPVHNINI